MVNPFFDSPAMKAWRSDRVSGASSLSRQLAALLAGEVERLGAGAGTELAALCQEIGRAHPGFGALWRLLDRALRVADKAAMEGTRANGPVAEALRAFGADLEESERQAGQRGADLIEDGAQVATYSRSLTVERALREAHGRGRRFRVLLSEGRPEREGAALAADLGAMGIPCLLASDGGLALLLGRASLLLLGADAVTPKGFLNKSGSYPLLLAARELNVPAYVLVARAKFLDPLPGTLSLPLHPGGGLAQMAPPVEVINAPIEEVPHSLVRGYVTESVFLTAGEAAEAARVAELHPALAR